MTWCNSNKVSYVKSALITLLQPFLRVKKVNLTRILSESIIIIFLEIACILHIQVFIHITSCSHLLWSDDSYLHWATLSIHCVLWLSFTSVWILGVGWNICSPSYSGIAGSEVGQPEFSSVMVIWNKYYYSNFIGLH